MIFILHNFLTYFLLSIAETIILHQLLTSFLTKNTMATRKYFLALFAYFIFQMITYLYSCPLFSTALYYFLFTSIIAVIFFIEAIEIKIITSCLFVLLNYSCKIFGVIISTLLNFLSIHSNPLEMILNGKTQIIACLLFLICVRIIIYFRRLRLQNKLVTYSIIIYTVPLAILYLAKQLFLHRITEFNMSFFLEIGGILFFTSLGLFYLLDKTVVINEKSEKSRVMKELMKLQEEYYSKLEISQKEIASMRHDIKNHLGCIQSMLNMAEYEEAKDYINNLYAKSNHLSSPIQSGNVIVDIILNQSLAKISDSTTEITINAILPPTLSIDNIDLCILLGNLLDNAIEACNRINDSSTPKFISLNISIKKDMLYIQVTNSFNGVINVENNIYRTVKKGHYLCGIGLSNVHKVVEKYHGEIDITYNEHVFKVSTLVGLV